MRPGLGRPRRPYRIRASMVRRCAILVDARELLEQCLYLVSPGLSVSR